jgi:putrescine aminotransferase
MNRQEIMRAYADNFNPTLALLFELAKCPVEATSKGVHVYDEAGDTYLDFAAGYGVFSVGHRNESVQAAVLQQLDTMASAPFMTLHQPAADLLRLLGSLLPGDLQRIFLAGSGSEAIEIALRTVRLVHPKRKQLVAVSHGFHGKTVGAVGMCGQDYLRKPFGELWSDMVFVPHGDATAMARVVGPDTAAVFLEPILGGGFVTVPPEGYVAEVRELCDRAGALLVMDEVQTGFGRTGRMFGFQHDDIIPDVLILSKGMTGGHVSMAAAVVRERYAIQNPALAVDPFAYASESAGWPVACAAAHAAIRFIVDNDLPSRASTQGAYLQAGLRGVAAKHGSLALDVPGRGLMTGVKLRNNMVENAVWLQMLRRKVLTGLSTNPMARSPVMRFFPPLVVERAEIDIAVEALGDSLRELDRQPSLVLDLANQVAKIQYHVPKPLLRAIAHVLG